MTNALPVLMEHSWVPQPDQIAADTAAKQKQEVTGIIVCPIDGQEIPACCCPLTNG